MHQSILLHSDLVLRDKYELTQKYMYITYIGFIYETNISKMVQTDVF